MRFLAHLDIGRAFDRALRRLGMQFGATRGRGARLSFGPPLPLGMTSEDEYLDFLFAQDVSETVLSALEEFLPGGLRILDWRPVRASVESLSQAIDRATYRVTFPEALTARLAAGGIHLSADRLKAGVERALALSEILIPKNPGDEMNRLDVRPGLIGAGVAVEPAHGVVLNLELAIGLPGNQRPETFLPILWGGEFFDARLARIHRQRLRISGAGREFSPLEVVELDFPWWRETLKRRAAGQRP